MRLTAGPQVRQAVTDVASRFGDAADAVSALPQRVPELLLVGPLVRGWRRRVEASIEDVHAARGVMAAVLELAVDEACDQPSSDRSEARV